MCTHLGVDPAPSPEAVEATPQLSSRPGSGFQHARDNSGLEWRSVPRDESMLGETLGCGPSSTTNSTLKPPKPSSPRRWRGCHAGAALMPLLQSTSSGAIFALGLGLEDALGLASAAVLIVLAGDRGEHVEHHGAQWAANMRP